ncbi:MAG: ATP-binding protein [Actinobacteria bacterium]|nr:ATP-binding protein [Actinomycetota bacterium]
MAQLVFLNGPPASGKSTLARRFVDKRPLALNLDVDVVRAMLGRWLEQPLKAGQAARAVALEMARTHLESGGDVIVPQFVGRPNFIDQLADVAAETGIRFVEIALMLDRESALAAFEERSQNPTTQSHVDAIALTNLSNAADPVGDMYDAYRRLIESRPLARRIEVTRGDIDTTMLSVEAAIQT